MNNRRLVPPLILSIMFFVFAGPRVPAQDSRGAGNKAAIQKRIALVIGNSAYRFTAPLPNPVNDASDMAAALRLLGFDVISGTDRSKKEMEDLIREFGKRLSDTKGVGLFFYAGHGIQSGGSNYLVPVDAEIPEELDVKYAAVELNFLLDRMGIAGNSLNIVILDACRNNPFTRSWGTVRDTSSRGGLAAIARAPVGTLIAYATAPGEVASDGSGRNGLYTQELLAQISRPNQSLEEVFKKVRGEVQLKSGNRQIPWESSSVEGRFYFAENEASAEIPKTLEVPKPVEKDPNAAERAVWQQVRETSNPADLELFISSFPTGIFLETAKRNYELLFWNKVKDSESRESLAGFLERFPDGQFASAAKFAIAKIDAASKPAEDNAPGRSVPTESAALPNGVEMKFVKIAAGRFVMGNAEFGPIHPVTITKDYWMGQTEVTQAQWKAVMGNLPEDCESGSLSGDFLGDNKPIVCIKWQEARKFTDKLNSLKDGYKYRLPTEAEWEYAARAGTRGEYAGDLDAMGWHVNNSGKKLHDVGMKRPNDWGLYDMHGGVWEWVHDKRRMGKYDYDEGPQTDPDGPSRGYHYRLRGGSFQMDPKFLKSAQRAFRFPEVHVIDLGFRVVRTRN